MSEQRISEVIELVRQKLQQDGVKLWLEPYHIEGLGPCEDAIGILSISFAASLSIPADRCRMALTELQHHAIAKRQANAAFAEHGIATIRVRATGNNGLWGGARYHTVTTLLTATGREFQAQIAELLGLPVGNVRLINAGRFLVEDETLATQSVRNHHQMMAVSMTAPQTTAATSTTPNTVGEEREGAGAIVPAAAGAATTENIYEKVARARRDAELLVVGRRYMDMEDQAGNTVHLPPEERRALIMALALHEKGKAALRREEYNEALVWLLEADDEYKRCGSVLVQSTDNWALLNLDVVWCYLCLKSVGELPEAEQRLYICERSFKRSYGENFDRVVALKGTAANERALIMRLHLLQAVIMYHQNRRPEAASMLQVADAELGRLRVSETALAQLVEMGYRSAEARIALRACNGAVEDAVPYILRQREERAEARRKSRAEAMLQVGRSKDETWVNPRSLHALLEMGFEKRLCEVALRKSKNDLEQAVAMLQTQSEALGQLYDEDFLPDAKTVDAMVAMGFDRALVELALRREGNNMDRALDDVMRLLESGEGERLLEGLVAAVSRRTATSGATSGATSTPGATTTAAATEAAKRLASRVALETTQRRVANEAFDRFAEDLDGEDDDHLDVSLEPEANVLAEYKRYLNN